MSARPDLAPPDLAPPDLAPPDLAPLDAPPGPALDWPALMRAGMAGLRLRPAEFWALTPAELSLLLGLGARPPAMGRTRLDELLRLYPDAPRPAGGP